MCVGDGDGAAKPIDGGSQIIRIDGDEPERSPGNGFGGSVTALTRNR
ncbi:MAG: hypothetical protein ACRD29_20440 [Acidimicrobiales bacterium]